MPSLELTENDVNFSIIFTVQDPDEAAVDLTGSTILFKMRLPGETTLQINGSCTLTDPTNGKCTYTVVAGDLDTVGIFNAELEITFPGSKVLTAKDIRVNVLSELP